MERSEKGARIAAGGTVQLLLQDADQEHTARDVLFVFNMVVRHLTGNRWGWMCADLLVFPITDVRGSL